jgi:methylated-DNA-[protein]-cysteine S-methyltransferase
MILRYKLTRPVISKRSFSSPFGFITITAEDEKITSVELCKKTNSVGSSKVLEDAAKQIDLYLKGTLPKFLLPLKVSGTPFQLAVWKTIAKVPFGKTISYGEIAAAIGKPQAARAVGAAVGANPTPLLVGCHRVLGSSGSLTGYSGGQGIKTKMLLLDHEGIYYE